MLMTFGGGEVGALLLMILIAREGVCKMISWYLEVIYLAKFVEVSVKVFKILDILETEFAR